MGRKAAGFSAHVTNVTVTSLTVTTGRTEKLRLR